MIVVTRPQEGEVWASGSTHEIEWSSYGVGPVDILFSTDAGGNWQTIGSSVADTGSYTWHLPDKADSNQCVISIVPSTADPNVVCIESGVFTIQPYRTRPHVPQGPKGPSQKKRAGIGLCQMAVRNRWAYIGKCYHWP